MALSLEHLNIKSKKILNEYFVSSIVEFNWESKKLVLTLSKNTKLGEISFKLIAPNQIEAEFLSEGNNLKTIFRGWEIIGNIGYSITGTYEITSHGLEAARKNIMASATNHKTTEDISGIAIASLITLIIFTDGAAAPLLIASG